MTIDQLLGEFYQDWNRKLEYALDENNPRDKRLEAMNWIDEQVGEELTTDATLDRICADLRDLI